MRNPILRYEKAQIEQHEILHPIKIVGPIGEYRSPEIRRGFLEKWCPKKEYASVEEVLNAIKYIDKELYQRDEAFAVSELFGQ